MLSIFALSLVPCLILFYLAVRGWSCVFAVLSLTALCQPLPVVCVPVTGIPSISILLGYDSPFIHLALHSYSLDKI